MRFRRHHDGEAVMKALLPGAPGFLMFACYAGDWQFVISYDQLHGTWTATYQPKHPDKNKPVSSTPCDNARPGERFRAYDTQAEAEKACERKHKQLRANN